MTGNFAQRVLAETEKVAERATTSFTMPKAEFEAFQLACKEVERTPSEVLRTLVNLFVHDLRVMKERGKS